jgi:Ran GTPase-activating protein (RanGAP) involved in mRNA processing and transport
LRGCEISKQETKALKKILDEGIKRIDVSYNPLADNVVDLLAGTSLLEIDLSGCQMTDKGMQALCQRIYSLEILKLRDNSLTEEHCKLMAKYLPEAYNMKFIDMSSNFIKDEGACWILSSAGHIREVVLQ